jgi:hypothetical protein
VPATPELPHRRGPKAVTCYLAYRRDGGENHNADGRLSLAVTEKLLAGNAAGAASYLDEHSAHPKLTNWLRPFVTALQAIEPAAVIGAWPRSLICNTHLPLSSCISSTSWNRRVDPTYLPRRPRRSRHSRTGSRPGRR